MSVTREEIMPGVWLSHIRSSKFKTAVMSISLLTQMSRETASANALIPSVLSRGTNIYPDIEKLGNRMDELYGADISPLVRSVGEIQAAGFMITFPEPRFLPENKEYTYSVISLAADMLLNPLTRGGLLIRDYVDSEKEKLAENIRARINEKRGYSVIRCIEEMCCFEDFAVGRFGSADDCESINYKKLTRQYHDLLQNSPVEILFCGDESFKTVSEYLKECLVTMPRGEIDYDIGTDIRMNSVEEHARYYEEHLDVTQGKLVLGFRLGEWMNEPDLASLSVFNALYGSGVTSKLFANVREKLHLCYYAGSTVNINKGIMIVSSGIDFDKFEDTKNEILFQLDEVKNGNFSADELTWAKASVQSDLRAIPDSPAALEQYYFSKIVSGFDISPDEYAAMIESVTAEDVIDLAKSIVPDMVYFLRNEVE